MIASFPMYNRPELEEVWDHFWSLIQRNVVSSGVQAPLSLSPDSELFALWTNPDLVLSQTCGMPFRKFLHGKVKLVGTPIHTLDDCPPGHYYSVFVVRNDDSRTQLGEFGDAKFAYNEENSQSGFAAPLNYASSLGLRFSDRVASGGHAISAEMVANRQADIAALDVVSWELIQRYDEFASALKIIERTKPTTPALPFITAMSSDANLLFSALEKAIGDLPHEAQNKLCLKGVKKIPVEEYLSIPNPII